MEETSGVAQAARAQQLWWVSQRSAQTDSTKHPQQFCVSILLPGTCEPAAGPRLVAEAVSPGLGQQPCSGMELGPQGTR